jgi:hypothetical protein
MIYWKSLKKDLVSQVILRKIIEILDKNRSRKWLE